MDFYKKKIVSPPIAVSMYVLNWAMFREENVTMPNNQVDQGGNRSGFLMGAKDLWRHDLPLVGNLYCKYFQIAENDTKIGIFPTHRL